MQQNGFVNIGGNNQQTNVQDVQQQGYAQQPQNGGVHGTWTGANTLTYTQSMQPPDTRNQHNPYCKYAMPIFLIKFYINSFNINFGNNFFRATWKCFNTR